MDAYAIQLTQKARRQLRSLSTDIQQRISKAIDDLARDPTPHNVQKLRGSGDRYRIRVGEYRIIYEIKDQVLIITVIAVGHRREIYRDM